MFGSDPLWMPKGSVRAILALSVVAAYLAGEIGDEVALLVLGAYFGSRTAAAP